MDLTLFMSITNILSLINIDKMSVHYHVKSLVSTSYYGNSKVNLFMKLTPHVLIELR